MYCKYVNKAFGPTGGGHIRTIGSGYLTFDASVRQESNRALPIAPLLHAQHQRKPHQSPQCQAMVDRHEGDQQQLLRQLR